MSEEEIDNLYAKIDELKDRIFELENEIYDKNIEIKRLTDIIESAMGELDSL